MIFSASFFPPRNTLTFFPLHSKCPGVSFYQSVIGALPECPFRPSTPLSPIWRLGGILPHKGCDAPLEVPTAVPLGIALSLLLHLIRTLSPFPSFFPPPSFPLLLSHSSSPPSSSSSSSSHPPSHTPSPPHPRRSRGFHVPPSSPPHSPLATLQTRSSEHLGATNGEAAPSSLLLPSYPLPPTFTLLQQTSFSQF